MVLASSIFQLDSGERNTKESNEDQSNAHHRAFKSILSNNNNACTLAFNAMSESS